MVCALLSVFVAVCVRACAYVPQCVNKKGVWFVRQVCKVGG